MNGHILRFLQSILEVHGMSFISLNDDISASQVVGWVGLFGVVAAGNAPVALGTLAWVRTLEAAGLGTVAAGAPVFSMSVGWTDPPTDGGTLPLGAAGTPAEPLTGGGTFPLGEPSDGIVPLAGDDAPDSAQNEISLNGR
jgi:hypothetical protein